ncbi:MAG: DegT/DnrJ/EryC1/StrS family aminotransferase [Gaiellaceae bacterium]
MRTPAFPVSPHEQTVVYSVAAGIARPLVRLVFRSRVSGLEHVPETGFVVASNQHSNLDGVALGCALYPRQVRWMGKAELFQPLVAPFMRGLGIFPVRRGEGDAGAVESAVALARAGNAVGIFPEGTRRSKGFRKRHAARPHTGAARVALGAGVPLVPAAIAGTERLLRLRRWRIAFGQPVAIDGLAEDSHAAAREATVRLWSAVTKLESELARRPRWLRPRLMLDVSLRDLLFALAACLQPKPGTEARVLDAWGEQDECLTCLSVRSAVDLLLEALELELGDEVALSAVTHPDIARIIEARGLRALPVDLELDTLAPRLDSLEQAVTPRTRLLVIAHLFGTRVDLAPFAEAARRHGFLLVEDCAQSFRGPDDSGDPLADVSLFSFGAIKTASALGGAIVCVRRPELADRMRAIESQRPMQPRLEYAARARRFFTLVLISRPRLYYAFERVLALRGRDLDNVVVASVRGFRADILTRIRRRPSSPLLALMERRLRRFDHRRLEGRTQLAQHMAALLPQAVERPGSRACGATDWVFPVLADNPPRLRKELRRAGFDSSTATTSIAAVPAPADRPELAPAVAESMLARVIFLPVYPELREGEVAALLVAVADATTAA